MRWAIPVARNAWTLYRSDDDTETLVAFVLAGVIVLGLIVYTRSSESVQHSGAERSAVGRHD